MYLLSFLQCRTSYGGGRAFFNSGRMCDNIYPRGHKQGISTERKEFFPKEEAEPLTPPLLSLPKQHSGTKDMQF